MSPKPLTRVIDLDTFSRKLPGGGERDRLKATIRRSDSADIIVKDLEEARRRMGALHTLLSQPDTGSHGVVGSALFNSALFEYVRSTHSRSDHRVTFTQLTAGLTPAQKAAHDALVGLRNDCLAHWGPGHDQQGSSRARVHGSAQAHARRAGHQPESSFCQPFLPSRFADKQRPE